MRNLFAFLLKNNFLFLFLILEIISIILISNHSYYQRSVIVHSTNQVTGTINRSFHSIVNYFLLKKVNQDLAQENAILRSILSDSLSIGEIKEVVVKDTIYGQIYQYVPARVVSNTVNKANNFIMLNLGILQGIKKDMAVIAPDGIVGIVKEVSRNFSTVLPVLHSQTKISAKIKRTNQLGTVVWDGLNFRHGTLADVPTHSIVVIGDTVITSGMSQIFPEGIMIGTVSDIDMDEGDNFYTLRIDFSVDYNSLGHVYIVRSFHEAEQTRLREVTGMEAVQ
ncbi:MAG: rod shape-determining protein MreC [Bacteroidales bacterium]|nr:rod shape-determining protein MreC [Lentimicrobiaceae bacterium]MDD5695200.1 rod shape-determining protein MreC [Bacteroidales bacterium]